MDLIWADPGSRRLYENLIAAMWAELDVPADLDPASLPNEMRGRRARIEALGRAAASLRRSRSAPAIAQAAAQWLETGRPLSAKQVMDRAFDSWLLHRQAILRRG